jgi:hypothetical protein
MPQRAWNKKRERQYEHIKEGLEEGGRSEDVAEEIAARTVNKERARSGEAKTASRSSVKDMSSSRRGGLRSHKGPGGRTKEQLYNEARRKGIKGRSRMNKAQLARAVGR